MSQTPFEHIGSLQIGTVDFVSSNEIKVALDIETPESMALNGRTAAISRVNSHVLIPVDAGFLVGQVEWLTVERSAFPKRRRDAGFRPHRSPYPLRRLSLNPLGTYGRVPTDSGQYIFQRGYRRLAVSWCGSCTPQRGVSFTPIVESGERKACEDRNQPPRWQCKGVR